MGKISSRSIKVRTFKIQKRGVAILQSTLSTKKLNLEFVVFLACNTHIKPCIPNFKMFIYEISQVQVNFKILSIGKIVGIHK